MPQIIHCFVDVIFIHFLGYNAGHRVHQAPDLGTNTGKSNLEDIPMTQVSDNGLAKVSQKIDKWGTLPPLLGLTPEEVDEVRMNHPQDYGEQKYRLLVKWGQKFGRHATWRRLAHACLECLRQDLVCFIRELCTCKYTSQPCTCRL